MSQTAPLVERELTFHERYRRGPRGGPKTAQDHADIVAACLDSAVQHILNAGDQLHQAKSQLKHGDWARMFRDHQTPVARPLPFGIRTAQRLMKISEVFNGIEATHVSLLPTVWGTLYELARVPEPILTRAFEEGRIHPAMRRAHVAQLLYRARFPRRPDAGGQHRARPVAGAECGSLGLARAGPVELPGRGRPPAWGRRARGLPNIVTRRLARAGRAASRDRDGARRDGRMIAEPTERSR